MANPVVQTRVTPALRAQANEILAGMGLDMAEYLRMAVTRLVSERTIPFELAVTDKTLKALAQSEADFAAGRFTTQSLDALMAEIDAEEA